MLIHFDNADTWGNLYGTVCVVLGVLVVLWGLGYLIFAKEPDGDGMVEMAFLLTIGIGLWPAVVIGAVGFGIIYGLRRLVHGGPALSDGGENVPNVPFSRVRDEPPLEREKTPLERYLDNEIDVAEFERSVIVE